MSPFFILPALLLFFLIVLPVFASLDNFTVSEDTTLLQSDPDFNFGDVKYLAIFDKNFQAGQSDILLNFDISSIPKNSRVNSAILRLFVNDTAGAYQKNYIFRNISDWRQMDATWNLRPKYVPERSAEFNLEKNKNEIIDINVLEDVKGFTEGSFENYGWTIKAVSDGIGGANISSGDDEHFEMRPKLIIHYTDSGQEQAEKSSVLGIFSKPIDILQSLYSSSKDEKSEENNSASTQNQGKNVDGAMASADNPNENNKAQMLSLTSVQEKDGIGQGAMIGSIFIIFLTMFYIFWKKEKNEAEI